MSSSRSANAGLKHVIMTVRLLPPSESLSNRVNLLSRYGTWAFFRFGSDRALITLPSARRPVLIETDSLKRVPWLPVRCALSEPAKSTKWNREKSERPAKEKIKWKAEADGKKAVNWVVIKETLGQQQPRERRGYYLHSRNTFFLFFTPFFNHAKHFFALVVSLRRVYYFICKKCLAIFLKDFNGYYWCALQKNEIQTKKNTNHLYHHFLEFEIAL